jgi:hypothetical protein
MVMCLCFTNQSGGDQQFSIALHCSLRGYMLLGILGYQFVELFDTLLSLDAGYRDISSWSCVICCQEL